MIGKEEPDSVRAEPPHAIRRAQKALPPAMDAAGLAKHLSVAELQVGRTYCFSHQHSVPSKEAMNLTRYFGPCEPTALHPLDCLMTPILLKTYRTGHGSCPRFAGLHSNSTSLHSQKNTRCSLVSKHAVPHRLRRSGRQAAGRCCRQGRGRCSAAAATGACASGTRRALTPASWSAALRRCRPLRPQRTRPPHNWAAARAPLCRSPTCTATRPCRAWALWRNPASPAPLTCRRCCPHLSSFAHVC